jgi:hypothetical protein
LHPLSAAILSFSIAFGAIGEGAARHCAPNCCGTQVPCQCGHDSHDGLGGQDSTNNGIPSVPQLPCRTGCSSQAAGGPAALGNPEVEIYQKSLGKAEPKKPGPRFAPFCPIKSAAREQLVIERLNLRRDPPGLLPSFEKPSARLALLATFRK